MKHHQFVFVFNVEFTNNHVLFSIPGFIDQRWGTERSYSRLPSILTTISPLQSYIIWLIDWLMSNNPFWYAKLNTDIKLPSLPLDKNNTFAVVKFLTVNLPSGHPCKLYTTRNVMAVGSIFQLYPIRVELQLNKFCNVENYLWSAPYAIKISIRCILGRRDVIKGNFHGILQ